MWFKRWYGETGNDGNIFCLSYSEVITARALKVCCLQTRATWSSVTQSPFLWVNVKYKEFLCFKWALIQGEWCAYVALKGTVLLTEACYSCEPRSHDYTSFVNGQKKKVLTLLDSIKWELCDIQVLLFWMFGISLCALPKLQTQVPADREEDWKGVFALSSDQTNMSSSDSSGSAKSIKRLWRFKSRSLKQKMRERPVCSSLLWTYVTINNDFDRPHAL